MATMSGKSPNESRKRVEEEIEGVTSGISVSRLTGKNWYPLNSSFLCAMCRKLLWKAQICQNTHCGMNICSPCVRKYFGEGGECPFCAQKSGYVLNKKLQECLVELNFKCVNVECREIIPYSDLLLHECAYERRRCAHEDCPWEGLKLEVEEHIEICLFQTILCPNEGCKSLILRGGMEGHNSICEHFLLICVNKCGCNIARCKMEDHINRSCELEKTTCKYKEFGCNEKGIRKEIKSHERSCEYEVRQLECGHLVAKLEQEKHLKECGEFPMKCGECFAVYTRSLQESHRCIEYLVHKILGLNRRIDQLALENKGLHEQHLAQQAEIDRVSSAGHHLESQFKACTSCGALFCYGCIHEVKLGACYQCNKNMCAKHMKNCKVCNHSFCEEHSMRGWENCQHTHCRGCAFSCPQCTTIQCRFCANICANCKQRKCLKCNPYCKVCEKVVCQHCLPMTVNIYI